MAIASTASLVDLLRRHRLLEPARLQEVTQALQAQFPDPKALAGELIRRNWLTPYQANQLLQGRGQELLLGSYVLLERLGEGGMGQVFKAHHLNLGRTVAVKIIRKDRIDSPEAVRRFQREVRAAAALSHPNIVLAFDADEIGGTHLLVMEHVEGGLDLAKLVKKYGPLPARQACEYARQAALGLQHAHECGMVHRDVKPANLLLTADRATVKVLDMGLARFDHTLEGDDKSTTMTQEGAIMGTPDYIAPEQALESHTVDIRADLYSLGCTLYFLLGGRVPFPTGTLLQKLNKHQNQEAPAVETLRPGVPPAVARVVRKLMAKRPEDRYQTPAEAAQALAAVLGPDDGLPMAAIGTTRPAAPSSGITGETIPLAAAAGAAATTETFGPSAPRRNDGRRRLLFAAAGGGLLLAGAVVLCLLLFSGPAKKAEPPGPTAAGPAKAPSKTKEEAKKTQLGKNDVPLFDGKTLNGWEGDTKYWSVVDGTMAGSGLKEAGVRTYLSTTRDFRNFNLRLDFKIVAGKSGVLFRGVPQTARAYQIGLDCDLDGRFAPPILIDETSGLAGGPLRRLGDRESARFFAAYHDKDWNHMELEVVDRHISCKINDLKLYELEAANLPQTGRVTLKILLGDTSVFYRDMVLEELP